MIMGQQLAGYGPDGLDIYSTQSMGMLFRPFHVTSESQWERQPLVFGNGNAITWDGRLDNRDDLINQLGLVSNDRCTDLDIVVRSFERWGTDSFSRIVGDWAIVMWHAGPKQLILARDYIGIKHLYYYLNAGRFMWCSHLTPLALCGDTFTVCDEYVAGYFAFHPEAHLTPYSEIRSVPPGCYIQVSESDLTITRYWKFDVQRRTRYKTDGDYEEHYRHLFRQAVRSRLRASTSVLAELSGGLDSSSIVCMADDIVRSNGTDVQVDTFSYFDSNEPGEDDLEHLTRIVENRGRAGFCVDLKGSGASLPLDYSAFEPAPGFGSRAEIKHALGTILSSHDYRVMLCGTGGDEMNGQPLDPRIHIADLLLDLKFRESTQQLSEWALLIRYPIVQLLLQSIAQLLPVSLRTRLLKAARVEDWLNPQFVRKYKVPARQLEVVEGTAWCRPSVRDALQTVCTLARLVSYTQPLPIETRYPFLDQRLVEFLTSIPLDQLLRPGQRRFLMRRALSGLLPPEVLQRKTKTGAGRCYSIALEQHWGRIQHIFDQSFAADLGFIDKNRVRLALATMKNGQVPASFLQLLKALSLELWLRQAHARGVIAMRRSEGFAATTRHAIAVLSR